MVQAMDTAVRDLVGLGEGGVVGQRETRVGWRLEVRVMLHLSWVEGVCYALTLDPRPHTESLAGDLLWR